MPQTSNEGIAKRRRTDGEIGVIVRIGRMLEALDADAQARVLRYLHERYCVGATATTDR